MNGMQKFTLLRRLKILRKLSRIIFLLPIEVLMMTSSVPHAFCNKVFPISTEFQIGKIKHMVEHAPEGVYISVGSERTFRGASMAPHITKVYLLDVSPEIIRFNQINMELLKAPNRETYLHLRWEATYEDWKKLNLALKKQDFEWWTDHVRDFGKMNYPLPEALNRYQSFPDAKKFIKMRDKLTFFYQTWQNKEVPSLPEKKFVESITLEQLKDLGKKFNIPVPITQEEWDWWTAYGKNKELDWSKAWLENPEEAVDLGQVVDFKTGNYLFDDKLYERLHNLALNNRFITMKIDLTDKAQLEKFVGILEKDKANISVLDLDNLYREEYIGDKNYKMILEKLLPFGQDNSLLIMMDNYKDYACGQFQTYIGFTFENIRHWPAYFFPNVFFSTLPKPLLELMNGRIYEKEEMPPHQYLLGK